MKLRMVVFFRWHVTIVLIILAVLFGVPFNKAIAVDRVTVQLNWFHQAQFAGFYAADQLGFYTAEGLEVSLLPLSEPNADVITPVIDGTADFGLNPGTALVTARSQGQPVTAIAAIYRRHPLVFITLAGSGIARPHDFPGHTMRALPPTGGAAIAFQAMMARLVLDPDSVRPVETGFDLSPFFASEVDIWPGFITNEVLVAREQGYQVNVILPEAYGVHTYGDTLFATEQLIRDNPDLVLRFLRATLRGGAGQSRTRRWLVH